MTSSRHQPHRLSPPRPSIAGHLAATLLVVGGAILALAPAACSGRRYEPSLATRSYPVELDQDRMIEMQVFRDGGELIIVNASPQSFKDFDLWVNRRYMLHIDQIDVGETRTFWFGDFFDRWGESPIAGGFFRTEAPTPIVLVQLQIGENTPLLGATSVPAEGSN